MTAQDLPANILTHIFSYLSPPEQIARYRLVCKNWEKSAVAVMLGIGYYLNLSSPATEKYYAFLAKDPARGKLVKSVNHSPIKNDNKRTRPAEKYYAIDLYIQH